MKHTEVTNEFDWKSLAKGDKLVFASIKRYMNKDTRTCFPSLKTIAKKLNCSESKIQKCIYRLEEAGLVSIRREEGKSNEYYFPPETDKFEMFTDEFLDMELDLKVKEYYMDLQPFLYGKETGIGRTTLSNTRLAEYIGLSVPTVKKYNTILIENGLLTEEETSKTDEAGLPVIQKNFNLTGLQQAALWVKAVTETVQKHDVAIEELEKKVANLEKELSLYRNKTQNIIYPEF